MLFQSPPFIFAFFPACALVYWLLPATGLARRVWLLLASILFYALSSLLHLGLLLALTGYVYLVVRVFLSGESRRQRGVGLGLIYLTLLPLLLFKYLPTWSGGGSVGAAGMLPAAGWLLPLGISFYTFNLLSYGFDVYSGRGRPATSLLDFASYTTFFPTIGSGPLMRYREFEPQQGPRARHPESSAFIAGMYVFTVGLAKKVLVADTLAVLIGPLFADVPELGLYGAWVAVIGYAYQLYFDFSGYSDMAIGLGAMLGFVVPQNFRTPYASRDITEFWQRWHMTLSNWFRDYVFFPLSRLLLRWSGGRFRSLVRGGALLVTMGLIGLWHGARWTFLAWGLLQGAALTAHAEGRERKWPRWPTLLARVGTFVFVAVTIALLRSSSLPMAGSLTQALVGLRGLGPIAEGFGRRGLLALGLLTVVVNLPYELATLRPSRGWAMPAAAAALLILSLLLLGAPVPFIYFQF